jgi:hypothetical protein
MTNHRGDCALRIAVQTMKGRRGKGMGRERKEKEEGNRIIKC